MQKYNKFLMMALDLSKNHSYDYGLEYHLCSIVCKGGSVISVGFNHRATCQAVEMWADKVKKYRSWCMSTHSEMDAILRARKKTDLTNCTIYTIRRRYDGGENAMGISKPCLICQRTLADYSFSSAYWSLDSEHFAISRINKKTGELTDKVIRCHNHPDF